MKIIKFSSIIFISLFVSLSLILFFSPKLPLLEGLSFSKALEDEHHQLLRLTLTRDEKYRLFVPLSALPQSFIEATLLQEDQYFYKHFAVNPFSLLKALWQTYVMKSRRIGASTITMQVVRLRYGIHSKKITGKLWQIFKAMQMERHYSKDQILEAYFNLAPFGGNVEGVGAASLIYFHNPSYTLGLMEALTLSVIPQNPGKRKPNSSHLKASRDLLFRRWLKKHPEDSEKKRFFSLPLAMYDRPNLSSYAPHFVNSALSNRNLPKSPVITTTLDYKIQTLVERITAHYLVRKKSLGVYNAAVLLVDTRDMQIKSLVGSADFFNQAISGQINGTQIKRSPGSTLKPFIYGLALDQSLIHPNTVLKDVPRSFQGYNPENFDYDFMGPIKAKDALVLSRNVPAIALSSQLKNPSLYQLLEQARVSALRPESYYGLSLNLGGVELTMQELVGLYAMLVNGGIWNPLLWFKEEIRDKGVRMLSPEASFLVLDMLENTPRQDYGSSTLVPAWKTGTSSGYRDAWTLGAFGPYVLAVWIGNFDNKANLAFVGKKIATPLWFELIEAIRRNAVDSTLLRTNPWTSNGHLSLERVEVCKASGMLPTPYCLDREWTWFIPGKSPIKTDTLFREVAINKKTGLRTCHIDDNTRFEVFEFWPSDLLKIFKKAGIQRHTPPFFEPDCELLESTGMSPQITSPQAGVRYVVHVNSSQNNKIPFTAVRDAGIAHLYWFVNERFIAKTKAHRPFFWQAKPGQFVVRVVDDRGLSDACELHVLMEG